MPAPAPWRVKHPCTECQTGYGICIQGLALSMKCCTGCDHPGRWQPEPYTAQDMEDMRREG